MAKHVTFYVDPVNGVDTNDGLTKATAFKTVLHASRDSLTGANVGPYLAGDTVVILVAPTAIDDGDHFRMNAAANAQGFNGGRLVVRCWQEGGRFSQRETAALPTLFVIGDANGTFDIDDIDCECESVILSAGQTTPTPNGPKIFFGSNCVFQKRTTASGFLFDIDSDLGGAELTITGSEFIGWDKFADATLASCQLRNMLFDAITNVGGSASLTRCSGRFVVEDCEFQTPNNAASLISFRAISTKLRWNRNTCVVNGGTGGSTSFALYGSVTTDTGSQEWSIEANNNVFRGSSAGPILELGAPVITDTPANNRAPWVQPQEIDFSSNIVINENGAGRCFNLSNGVDGANINNNYIRQGAIGSVTNVHGIYCYAQDVRFTNNRIQSQIMCFQDMIKVDNNVIVASLNQPILLGGNAGGSTVQSGGNDYCITNNVLVGQGAALDDYAWNNAYGPTGNLGELKATIDNNIYLRTDISTAGALRIGGAYQPTIAAARTFWQTWGDASNASNSQYDFYGDAELLRSIELAIQCNGGKLSDESLMSLGLRARSASHVNASKVGRDWARIAVLNTEVA